MRSEKIALVVVMTAGMALAGEIDVAREALRDGLWTVARTHAARSDDPRSQTVVFESYAREGRWAELRDSAFLYARAHAQASGAGASVSLESCRYYQALAEYRLGEVAAAKALLAEKAFTDATYAQLAVCLRAAIAEDAGDAKGALALLNEVRVETNRILDVRMVMAGLKAKSGDRSGAEADWREVIAEGTNVSERAYTIAAVELGGVAELRKAYSNAVESVNRRLAGFALGRALVTDAATFPEGARIIRRLVWDNPDAPEAKDAFLALGEAAQALSMPQEALKVYQEALDAWPASAKSAQLHFGRGWALTALARYDEALEAFASAGELAEGDADRALAMVKRGDVMAASGRGEEALKVYRRVLETYPDSVPAHIIAKLVESREHEQKGRELYRAYNFEEADREFAAAAKSDASLKPRMDFFHALCLYGEGQDAEAKETAEALAAGTADKQTRAAATLWLAKLAYNAGDWAKARELFGAFVKLDADSSEVAFAMLWSARAAFAANDFAAAISQVTELLERYPESEAAKSSVLVQAEALIELSRFDEAVVVLDRLATGGDGAAGGGYRAQLLKADALFAMGADNSLRYADALAVYVGLRTGAALSPSERITVSFRIAKTLEKLKRADEAYDSYYTDVVLAYREGRSQGMRYSDEAQAAFSRAAFRVADNMESRGRDRQAVSVLKLVAASDVPAAAEAKKRIERIKRKGNIL